MIIVMKPYCHDGMCGADDCSTCRGPGAYDDETGDEVEACDEPPDEPEPRDG